MEVIFNMSKKYEKNLNEINNILYSLEGGRYSQEEAEKNIGKVMRKIKKCLDILEESEPEIRIVTEKSGRLTFKNFKV